MAVNSVLLHGNSLDKGSPPKADGNEPVSFNGWYHDNRSSFALNEGILGKHIMMVGGTGSGKTNVFYHIIQQLQRTLTPDDMLVIFDTKGDFYDHFYNKKDTLIGNSLQFNSITEQWNIFKEIVADGWSDRQIVINAQELARNLFFQRIHQNNSNPFFPNAACDLFASILICFTRAGKQNQEFKKNNLYNSELKLFFDAADSLVLKEWLGEHIDLRAVCSYIDGDSAQSQGVIAEMQSVIREIFIGSFGDKGGFSVRNLLKNKDKNVLFIEYDLSVGEVLTPIYRLLIDLAFKEALSRKQNKGNIYFIIDEFKLLPNLQHVEDAVNFGRSLGVKVMVGLQSIDQLYEIYGENKGKNIAAGFSSTIAFKTNDMGTRKYVSGLFGENVLLEQYQKLGSNYVEEKRQGLVVEDWDINALKIGEAIIGLSFEAPFKFLFDLYK